MATSDNNAGIKANVNPGSGITHFYSYGELKKLWTDHGGSAATAPVAAAVALAESGGNPNATHTNSDGSIDRGLWQINSVHGAQSTTDIGQNVKAALAISNHGTNWNPWTTFKSGAFKKFLNSKDDYTIGTTDATDVATGAVDSSVDALKSIGKFAASLVNPATWLHVLEFVGGVILFIMGLRVLTGNSAIPPLSSVAKVA